MDLGCIDMGCVEKPKKETSVEKENSPKESASGSKFGKNNKYRDAVRTSLNALNKVTSQISKPPRRKTSPLNWFPRKKVEPYLKRKIKMLQEVDGMHSTLDETLGDSNPHYSRVLREKIAIREAAEKAMEARKAAMVEASWCRILQAARIESKEAEAQLSKAEAEAVEAFEAARAAGVIMNDIPGDSSQKHYQIEMTSTTHSVLATFETAFEVDKQVASAVKAAFIMLANCPSISKDEFKELLRKISENPDTDETNELSTSEYEADSGSEVESGLNKDSLDLDRFSMDNIVDMMLGRLRCLKEDELASLATIVATSGLNAALSEMKNSKQNECPKVSRTSLGGRNCRNSIIHGQMRVTADGELPSLDKFLVKRLTRLEKEVLEAKNARKHDVSEHMSDDVKSKEGAMVSDLGSVLVKRSSKLEKEVEEARLNRKSFHRSRKQDVEEKVPMVKRLTRLEREVEEAKQRNLTDVRNGDSSKDKENKGENKIEAGYESLDKVLVKCKEGTMVSDLGSVLVKRSSKLEKEVEEARLNRKSFCRSTKREVEEEVPSLDKVLVKRLTRLEREVEEAKQRNLTDAVVNGDSSKDKENMDGNKIEADYESLDKILVKHVSRLERDKLEFCGDERSIRKPNRKANYREAESNEGSLDQVLVKHKSRLEREKTGAAADVEEPDDSSTRYSVSRRQAREKEMQAAWGGLSLGNSIRPHVSRLQKDKAAWLKAEEEERNREVEGEV